MDKVREKKKRTKPGLVRYLLFVVALFAIFVWLVSGLVNLQLKQEEVYAEKAESQRTKTIALRGKRGTISSADSVILAEDEMIYNVTFYRDASAGIYPFHY